MTASVALSGVAILAVTLALADIYVKEGDEISSELFYGAIANERDFFGQSEAVPEWSSESQASWEEAHRFLQLARVLDPLNPKMYANLGALSGVKVPEQGTLDADAFSALDRALDYYRRSVALRPAWPYGWTDVALVKLRQGRLDGEFALAVERATTLGPWESYVHYRIADEALKVFDDLPENVQHIVRLTVERYRQDGSEWMDELAEQHGFTSAGDEFR